MPTHSNELTPPTGLSVVNKQTDQTSTDSSVSPQDSLAESESPLASLRSNIEPQSLRHNIGILDLADELLMNIFDHASGDANIRNIRLTCRRFCSTSSHLLLECLDVYLTAASLARAKDISCHPTISKGVRVLRISLQAHSHLQNFSVFQSRATSYLREVHRLVLSKHQNAFLNRNFAAFLELQSVLKEMQRLLSSWDQDRLVKQGYATHQQSLDVEVLERAYGKYRMAREWQQRAMQDGTFVQAIAAAVGRMPRATRILFTDTFPYRARSPEFNENLWRNRTSASDIFDDRMTLSVGVSSLIPESKPTEFAVQVPLAIHAAGFPAVEIGVQCGTGSRTGFEFEGFSAWFYSVSPPQPTWIRNQAQLLGLKAAAESLKVFTFTFDDHIMRVFSLSEDMCSASTYLRVVLGAANLQVITLSVPSTALFEGHVGSLLAPLRWPHLREINLSHIAFHLTELKRLVDGFQPGTLLKLNWIHLRSGSWAEGLDVLRSKANPESQVGSLSGAECGSISWHQRRRIMEGWKEHWASQYVQGVSIRNPFLVTEDETADVETSTGTV